MAALPPKMILLGEFVTLTPMNDCRKQELLGWKLRSYQLLKMWLIQILGQV